MAAANGTTKKNKTSNKKYRRKYTCFCDPRREKYKIGTHQPCVLVLATPLPTVFLSQNTVPKFLYLWNSVIFK